MSPAPAPTRDWFFDCDGVLLDSNDVKTQAFAEVALPYGAEASERLVDFHRTNGGISRFVKIRHLFEGILGREAEPGEYEAALEEFARRSSAGVRAAAVDPAAAALATSLRDAGNRCYVVSGAAQDELRDALDAHGLTPCFDGVYGSPDTKLDIVDRLRAAPAAPGTFVGDSRLDAEVAAARGLDFVFVTHWTEFDGWEPYFAGTPATVVRDLGELADVLALDPTVS